MARHRKPQGADEEHTHISLENEVSSVYLLLLLSKGDVA